MQVDSRRRTHDLAGVARGATAQRVSTWMFVVAALAVAIPFHFVTRANLWLDEALTVNIARLPLRELPGALRHDGAPPLYYVLLHIWMSVVGEGDLAARSLAGAIGVATLPVAYFTGARLGRGDRARGSWIGWALVLMVATSPFALRYSNEARMYSLVIALVFLGYLAVQRALERPTYWRLAGVSLATGALLYTHYWAFFLLAVVGAIFVARAVGAAPGERRAPRRVLVALATGCLLFVPWLPILRYQLAHTGTPWAAPTLAPAVVPYTLSQFAGGPGVEGRALLVALALLALLALFVRARSDGRYEIAARTVPGVRWEWLVGGATLLLGLWLSYLVGATYQSRYAAVVFPFVVMVAAFGVTVVTDPRLRAAVLATVVMLGLVGGLRAARTERTQAARAAAAISADARAGDVVGYCPDQLAPSVSRSVPLSLGVHQYEFPGFRRPTRVDWVDYARRTAAANPVEFARGLLERAGAATIWYVWSPGYGPYDMKCERILAELRNARPGGQTAVLADDRIYEHMGVVRFGS